jgi:hypothetical protein
MALYNHPYHRNRSNTAIKNCSHYPLTCKATNNCNVETENLQEFKDHMKTCPAQRITSNCPMCPIKYTTSKAVHRHINQQFMIDRNIHAEYAQLEMEWKQSHELIDEPANTNNDVIDNNDTAENTDLNPESTDYEIALSAEKQEARSLKHQFTDRVLEDQQFARCVRQFETDHLLQLFLSNAISMTIFTTIITLIHGVCDLIVDRALGLVKSKITLHKVDVPESAMNSIEKSFEPLRTPFQSLITSYKTNKTLARSDTYSEPVCREFENRPHTVGTSISQPLDLYWGI